MNTKHFASIEVKALDENDAGPYGSFEAVLSASTLDRDGEVIDKGAFEPLPSSIPILADHEGKTASLIGSAVPYYDGDVLKVRGKFASKAKAQEVRKDLLEGHLSTMSVGFMKPTKAVRDGVTHITQAELLEGSFVVIPSNREATLVGAKSLGGPLTGSWEDTQEDLRFALRDFYGGSDTYVWLIATYNDRVVYQVESWPTSPADGTYETTYEINEAGEMSLGEPLPVEIEQVVSPKTFSRISIKAGRRNSNKDQDALDRAHEAIVLAGANCTPAESEDDGKSKHFRTVAALEADLIEFDLDHAVG